MIHAGKIDENFSKQEEMIIKQALLKMGADTENIQEIIKQSKIIEENANQILDFTKEVKVMDEEKKISETIEYGKTLEENSNQILDFTKEVKNLSESEKIKIIEALWSIIYSNKDADIYETNLMRRLAGLLYIDNKTIGDIKEKIKKNIT